ncbi:MAG: efflux RND transporter periplasmic adaptor subunit [Acidobacteria bacterium]|nr:MAG: efflux RND transporter periplasmic adaptor subunit [Acidobacteriota bacterium]
MQPEEVSNLKPSIAVRVRRWLVLLAVLGAIAAAAGFLVQRAGRQAEEKYRTENVGRGDIVASVTATGTLSAVTTVLVGSQVSGIISRLHADFNSPVKQGQLLAEIDPTPFQAAVEQHKADLLQKEVQMRNAEINLHRQQRLLADNLAPQADFDAAKAAYDEAVAEVRQSQAALDQAETNLRYTKIVSPIDGVVVARQFDVGQTVAASFQAPTLFTIAQDLTKMQVQADVDQSDIGRVRVGQHTKFTVDAYPDKEFRGRISQIRLNATISQNVITYPVIIQVDNPEGKLRPQMAANVAIEVARVHNVLRVPSAALRFRPPEEAATAQTGSGSASAPGQSAALRSRPPVAARTGASNGNVSVPGHSAAGRGERGTQNVYLLVGAEELKPVSIRTGISDGMYTEVLEGEIKEGDRITTGLATTKADSSSRFPGGRMF